MEEIEDVCVQCLSYPASRRGEVIDNPCTGKPPHAVALTGVRLGTTEALQSRVEREKNHNSVVSSLKTGPCSRTFHSQASALGLSSSKTHGPATCHTDTARGGSDDAEQQDAIAHFDLASLKSAAEVGGGDGGKDEGGGGERRREEKAGKG
ncbi:unnamed protein product [Pleuronectes platessa]|uniref:Uncharacterized protein n=1 Tax=Pleuronectes platessa TaxID=8262 RepID=A0A9N7VB55_PLEPL|nr:unnamed protein product [Pleuronectes platessa]